MSLDALDLYNHRVFDNDINSLFPDGLALLCERERYLAAKVESVEWKFYAKGFFVSLFQKPRTKIPVHLDGASYYLFGNFV